MFSIGYIDKEVDGTSLHENLHGQSLRVIVINRSSVSNMVEFYHSPSKQLYFNALYWLDPALSAGPIYNRPYDGGSSLIRIITKPTIIYPRLIPFMLLSTSNHLLHTIPTSQPK